MAPKGFRGSRSVVSLCFAVIGIVLYTILVANVTKMYHRSRSATAARPGGAPDAQGAGREDNNAARARQVRITEDEPGFNNDFASWSSSSSNSSSKFKCPHRAGTSGMECSGHGLCNASTMYCACHPGYSGAACDIDLRAAHDVLEYFQKAKLREDAAALSGSESLPRSNALLQKKHVSQLLTVVVPLITKPETSDQAGLQSQWRRQLIKSIKEYYPGITVVEQLVGDGGGGGIVSAWNDALRTTVKTPWTLLLSPATIAMHDQTNLELMLTLLLSSDIDVLGFSTLTPATSESTGELLQPTQKGSDKSGQKKSSAATPSGREEFVYHIDCWNFHGPERWTLSHEKPLFGYHRHAASYAVICDRSSESIIIRTPSEGTPSLFNASMDVSALTDFYLRTKRSGGVVGTCVECLLKTRLESPFESANSRANKRSNKDGFDVWGTYVLPSAWRTTSVLSSAFAERYQVEAVVGPHRLDVALHKKFQSIPMSTLETPFDTIAATGRIRCTKSGGIYGHSKNGLYSPLCHRYQRQRDFLYLSSLWVNGWGEGIASSSSPRSSKYGVSLHHGNLFGALRFGAELLWETDGDFDFVSFDDSHDAMMQRWQSFISYVTTHAGFETKVPYPEKPWYVNFLRDKTDFQLNVRGIHSEFTRGRPPHIHNISVYYQGYRTYMNGFQNPWQGIRADPGHDYRRRYLTQQGWVLAFTKKAISCKVEGHPSCLPPCGDPAFQSRHQFCDESWLLKADAAIGDGPRPLDVHPTHLRDPILFV